MEDIRKPGDAKESSTPKVTETSQPSKKVNKQKTRRRRPRLLTVFLVLILLALAAGSFFLYQKYRDTQAQVDKLSTVQGQQELSNTQVNELLGEMRAIILLPSDEDPVVATITDINLLRDKDFYKDAQNGDRVVVFASAKKAYIYRPSEKKIINVGAFEVSNEQQ